MESVSKFKSFIKLIAAFGIFIVLLILFNMFTYTTQENEYTVVKQFGEIKRVNKTPGIRVKMPLIQTVNSIPKSKQFYDSPKSDVITSDKKTMVVDTWVTWEVEDAKLFTSSLNANTNTAEGRIDVIVYNAIKNTMSNMTQEELIISRDDPIYVANGDTELEDVEIKDINSEDMESDNKEQDNKEPEVIAISEQLLKSVEGQCSQYGISIKDIEVKILDLPEENKTAVYERMITERNNIAAAYIAQGQSEAQVIKNTTNKEASVMKSDAQAKADKIIAEGEAEYMQILSQVYNDKEKADFYLFVKSLDMAKESLNSNDNVLFLDKDSPIAQIFLGTKQEKK